MTTSTDGRSTIDVLYVEDQPMNMLLMEALFERRPGLRLVGATHGQHALEIGQQVQPELLLLDLRLPDCHGTTLLPVLRARFGWADVPAIAVTAESDFDPQGTGFLEVWTKPLDVGWVLERLDALLARHLGVAVGA